MTKKHYFRKRYYFMLNILVPTDFSKLSKVAVQYAIKIANQLDGTITLLHVVTVTKAIRASMKAKFLLLESQMMEKAEGELKKLMNDLCKGVQTTEPVKCVVVRGASFQRTLAKEARRLRTGLIVMGTKGASGLTKTVVGSNTTSVIELSKVPVLAVPAKASFKGFKEIVYASDLKQLDKELKTLLLYAKNFGSVVHVVHVVPHGKTIEEIEEKIDSAVKRSGYSNMVAIVLVDRDVDGAIDQYIQVSKADLLSMFTHNVNFYEKLFDKSKTREMAFHSRVPLLAFKTR